MSQTLNNVATIAVVGGAAFLIYEVVSNLPSSPNIPNPFSGSSDPNSLWNPNNTSGFYSDSNPETGGAIDNEVGCNLQKITDPRWGFNDDTKQCQKYSDEARKQFNLAGHPTLPNYNLFGANVCKNAGGWFDQSQSVIGRCCSRASYIKCNELPEDLLIKAGKQQCPPGEYYDGSRCCSYNPDTKQTICHFQYESLDGTTICDPGQYANAGRCCTYTQSGDQTKVSCHTPTKVDNGRGVDPSLVKSWEENCKKLQGYYWDTPTNTCISTAQRKADCESGRTPGGNTWDPVNNQCYFQTKVVVDPSQQQGWIDSCNKLEGYHWDYQKNVCTANI